MWWASVQLGGLSQPGQRQPRVAAVAGGQGDALSAGEQARLASEVEDLSALVQGDRDGAAGAEDPLHGGDRDRQVASLEASLAEVGVQGVPGDQDPHRGGA